MRIAYLTGEYPRVTDTFIQREVAALRHHGATVKTFSVRSPRSAQALSPAQQAERDRTTYLLPPSPFKLVLAHLLLLVGRPTVYLQAIQLAWKTRQLGVRGTLYQLIYFIEAGLLAHELKQQQIEHVHNHFGDSSGTVTLLASALSGIGYSFTLHGPGIFFEPHRWHINEKIRRAKFVSCISYFCRSQAMIFAPLEAWSHLHIVHCGVDPAQFELPEQSAGPQELQEVRSQPSQELIFVGRLAAAKGLPVLLESLAQLRQQQPAVHLTVVGDGPDREILADQVLRLGIAPQVTFVGAQPPAAVRDYLKAADIFVMSSFAEGVPVVLMEAMMSGLPVVATQIAGVSELVEEGVNGFLVPPSDPVQLCDRLQQLLSDQSLRQRLGAQGRQKVMQDFNIYTEAHKLYRIMAAAIQNETRLETDLEIDLDPNLNLATACAKKEETVLETLSGNSETHDWVHPSSPDGSASALPVVSELALSESAVAKMTPTDSVSEVAGKA